MNRNVQKQIRHSSQTVISEYPVPGTSRIPVLVYREVCAAECINFAYQYHCCSRLLERTMSSADAGCLTIILIACVVDEYNTGLSLVCMYASTGIVVPVVYSGIS